LSRRRASSVCVRFLSSLLCQRFISWFRLPGRVFRLRSLEHMGRIRGLSESANPDAVTDFHVVRHSPGRAWEENSRYVFTIELKGLELPYRFLEITEHAWSETPVLDARMKRHLLSANDLGLRNSSSLGVPVRPMQIQRRHSQYPFSFSEREPQVPNIMPAKPANAHVSH